MLADTLRELNGARLTRHGREITLALLPPATEAELREIEAGLPGPMPEEIRVALLVSKGLANGPLESFSLVDLAGFGLDEVFPHPYSLAHDGSGNYWIVDVLPAGRWGAIWYACHDPPVIAYQAGTVDEFLRDVVGLRRPGPTSPVDRVHDEVVHRIWREDPDLLTPDAAGRSGDAVLQPFAATLPETARIADLRQARVGQGFAWGRHGPRTELRRAGAEPVWAILPPERKPGLLARIFGC